MLSTLTSDFFILHNNIHQTIQIPQWYIIIQLIRYFHHNLKMPILLDILEDTLLC